MAASDPDSPSKAKSPRKRKSKSEKEAEQAAQLAEAASGSLFPPEIWMLLGLALLIVAACVFFDPIGFATAPQPADQTILHTIITWMVEILGKNPVSIVFGVGGGLSLIWGVIGWLRQRGEKTSQ